jgi:cephalosporin hydroxylase
MEMEIAKKFEELCSTPSDINEHLATLKDYASKCSSVTEMGVRWVVSTWALLAGSPKWLTSYDIQHPSIYGVDMNEVHRAARRAGIAFNFYQRDVLELESIDPTDLLFIDTLHTYGQLVLELEKFSGYVSKYIILHDTTTFGRVNEIDDGSCKQGIRTAMEEFLVRKRGAWKIEQDFTNNNGLTILTRA